MASIPNAITDRLIASLADETPEGATVKWCHFDLVSTLRAEEALAAECAADFRLRAYHQRREQLLLAVRSILRNELPAEREYSSAAHGATE